MQQSSVVIPEIYVYNAVVMTRRVTSLTAGFLDPRLNVWVPRTNQRVIGPLSSILTRSFSERSSFTNVSTSRRRSLLPLPVAGPE
jgi:hypothetical protein